MKRLMQVICAVFLLCGCDGANEHQQQQDLLEQLQTQLENRSFSVSDSLPFQYDVEISQEGESYSYVLVIDHFEHAMYDVKVVGMPLQEPSRLCFVGFEEEAGIQIIPNQEDVEKGYYSSITLNGTFTSSDDVVGVVIQWKDVSGVNTYQRYWEIDCASARSS